MEIFAYSYERKPWSKISHITYLCKLLSITRWRSETLVRDWTVENITTHLTQFLSVVILQVAVQYCPRIETVIKTSDRFKIFEKDLVRWNMLKHNFAQ